MRIHQGVLVAGVAVLAVLAFEAVPAFSRAPAGLQASSARFEIHPAHYLSDVGTSETVLKLDSETGEAWLLFAAFGQDQQAGGKAGMKAEWFPIGNPPAK